MTRVQAAEVLGIRKEYVQKAFEAACKEDSTLDRKNADYTLDEMLFALQFLRTGKGLTEVEKIILEEDFFMNTTPAKAIGIDGTEEFLEKVKYRPKTKCCATCTYCIKSTVRNNKPTLFPYCNFFERYLHLLNSKKGKRVDVYKDHCKAWKYSEQEPLIFYKADSPKNLDIYGNEINEVMGYDVSCFTKSTKSTGLITDVGMDVPDIDD